MISFGALPEIINIAEDGMSKREFCQKVIENMISYFFFLHSKEK